MTCPILSARGLRTAPNPETYSLKQTASFRPFGARSLPQLDPLQLTSPSRPVPWLRMGVHPITSPLLVEFYKDSSGNDWTRVLGHFFMPVITTECRFFLRTVQNPPILQPRDFSFRRRREHPRVFNPGSAGKRHCGFAHSLARATVLSQWRGFGLSMAIAY